jgi:tRNA (Thr-GGU) A37 N-methylase
MLRGEQVSESVWFKCLPEATCCSRSSLQSVLVISSESCVFLIVFYFTGLKTLFSPSRFWVLFHLHDKYTLQGEVQTNEEIYIKK